MFKHAEGELYIFLFFHVLNQYHLAYNTLFPHVLHRLITHIFLLLYSPYIFLVGNSYYQVQFIYDMRDIKVDKMNLTRKCLLFLNVFCRINIKTKRWDNQNILKEIKEVERREWSQKRR